MSTYREEIQLMISQLQAVFDKAEYLRDQSDSSGQKAMNQLRRSLPEAWSILQNLDGNIDNIIANQEV